MVEALLSTLGGWWNRLWRRDTASKPSSPAMTPATPAGTPVDAEAPRPHYS
jgi:hypothetical protein